MQDDFLNRPQTISLDVQQKGWGDTKSFPLPNLCACPCFHGDSVIQASWTILLTGKPYFLQKPAHSHLWTSVLSLLVCKMRTVAYSYPWTWDFCDSRRRTRERLYLCLKEGRGTGSRVRNLSLVPRSTGGRQWRTAGARHWSSNHPMKDISLSKRNTNLWLLRVREIKLYNCGIKVLVPFLLQQHKTMFFKKILLIYFWRGEGREKERERNINVWFLSCAPDGGPGQQPKHVSWISNPLVCRLALNPLSHTSQG